MFIFGEFFILTFMQKLRLLWFLIWLFFALINWHFFVIVSIIRQQITIIKFLHTGFIFSFRITDLSIIFIFDDYFFWLRIFAKERLICYNIGRSFIFTFSQTVFQWRATFFISSFPIFISQIHLIHSIVNIFKWHRLFSFV